MPVLCDTLDVSVVVTPTQTPSKISGGEPMPQINIQEADIEDLDEAIRHLRHTQLNSHDWRMALWCPDEINRMLDAKLELIK